MCGWVISSLKASRPRCSKRSAASGALRGGLLPEAIDFVGQRGERLLDEIGERLRHGQVQPLFGAEVIGDGGDILAGPLGDVAGGGALQAAFAEQFGRRGEQLPARLLAARSAGGLMRDGSWHGSRSKLINHMINFMPDCLKRNR